MFLHLGVDTIVPMSSVIAIFDVKITKSNSTADYIKKMRNSENLDIIDISNNKAKSFIITDKAIYFSTISSLTLKKRAVVVPG